MREDGDELSGFDQVVALGTEDDGNRAFFGRDVLRGLIQGIDEFVHERQPRWERRSHRTGSPALLGCTPWLTDQGLMDLLRTMPACVVMTKEPHHPRHSVTLPRLRALNREGTGMELRALSSVGPVAPKVDGKPQIMGPFDRLSDFTFSTVRTWGFRKGGAQRPYPPIAHAKLALLGNICWTDEHPAGMVDDYIWFQPKRLWVSSANFTFSSRASLEFGYWTEDPALMEAVKVFLVALIGASEDLDAVTDTPDPDLVEVELDNQAMAEATGGWDDDDEPL